MNTIELHERRAELTQQLHVVLEKQAKIKDRLLVTMPHHEYQKVESTRRKLGAESAKIQSELSMIKLALFREGAGRKPQVKDSAEVSRERQAFAAAPTIAPTEEKDPPIPLWCHILFAILLGASAVLGWCLFEIYKH